MSRSFAHAGLLAAALALAAPARADLPPAEYGYDPDHGAFVRTRDRAWELNPYGMVELQQASLFAHGGVSSTTFSLHAAKLILHGHVFHPSLTYHFQLNAGEGKVVAEDVYLRWDPDRAIGLLAGQIEVPFNREHITLEAYQELIDRSIADRHFTLQRDIGAAAYAGDRAHRFEATLGVWNGARQDAPNDDETFMGTLRLAWNPWGPIVFREGDLAASRRPLLSVAAAGAYNPARVVADPTGASQDVTLRHVAQAVLELTFRFRGVSLSTEVHVRHVDVDAHAGRLDYGGVGQIGVLILPKRLEIAARFAAVDGRLAATDPARELTLGLDYYFRGHRLKLQADSSRLELGSGAIDYRVRSQLQLFL